MIDSIIAKFGADTTGFQAGLDKMQTGLDTFNADVKNSTEKGVGKTFKNLTRNISEMTGGVIPALSLMGVAAVGAIAVVTAGVKYGIEKWEKYKDAVSALNATFKEAGVSGKSFVDAINGRSQRDPEVNAREDLKRLEQERRRINEEQKNDKFKDPRDSMIGAALADTDLIERTNERQKRLNEIQTEQAAAIQIIKKAEADKKKARDAAEVEASKVAATNYELEKKKTEEAKKRYNDAVLATAEDEEKLMLLQGQLEEIKDIGKMQKEGSAEQIDNATEYLKIQQAIKDVQKSINDAKDKTNAEEKKKIQELKDLERSRAEARMTDAEKYQDIIKRGREAEQRVKDNPNDIDAKKDRSKLRKEYEDFMRAHPRDKTDKYDIDAAVNSMKGKDGKIRNKDGHIVSEEDRKRSIADRLHNKKMEDESAKNGRIGNDVKKTPKTAEEYLKEITESLKQKDAA